MLRRGRASEPEEFGKRELPALDRHGRVPLAGELEASREHADFARRRRQFLDEMDVARRCRSQAVALFGPDRKFGGILGHEVAVGQEAREGGAEIQDARRGARAVPDRDAAASRFALHERTRRREGEKGATRA